MRSRILVNRKQIESDLLELPDRHLFTPIYYAQQKITLPLIEANATGLLIDLGCGDMPYKNQIINKIERYDSLDFFPRSDQVTYIDDLQNMTTVPDQCYDTAICLEVLEHISEPTKALKEILRILKPGGKLILTVPHLSRLHDQPHDYFRYTSYGLRYLLRSANFHVRTVLIRGGMFSFIGHQISTLLLGSTWHIPVIRQILWFFNGLFITRLSFYLDRWIDKEGIFAQGYTVLAQRPLEENPQ